MICYSVIHPTMNINIKKAISVGLDQVFLSMTIKELPSYDLEYKVAYIDSV